MHKKLSAYAAPLIILPVFFFVFYYTPGVKEEHFNILILASVLTPFAVILLAKLSLRMATVQSVALQLAYTLYGIWYWNHQDALTDHYFSFENDLRVGLLLKLFIGSFLLATLIRLVLGKISKAYTKSS